MRGLAFAFVASCILWCLLTWCTVCAGCLSGTMSAEPFDLIASLAFIGLAAIVICLYVSTFDDPELGEPLTGDCFAEGPTAP